MKKVLQIHFNGSWNDRGCLQHITQAWSRRTQNYEHFFASAWRAHSRDEVEGRPHFFFTENRLANRLYNKILRLNKLCTYELIPIVEKVKPDILHFHNRHDLVDQIMVRLSYRPRVVCHYHFCYNELPIPASANYLIGVSKLVVAWIDRKAEPSQPLAVLHNPFSPLDAIEKRTGPEPLIINYSNIRKATRDLFQAVERLNGEGFSFAVQCLGHVFSDLTPPKNVTVSRSLPQLDYLDLVARSNAFLSTSYGTPFSVAVLEAMARDTPVICPWDIGVLDLLPQDCVISYESHSVDALADALRKLLQMPETERRHLAQQARQAAEVYDETVITRKLERIYDAL
ncbi:MAG: glycosyltransferase family 4 protein [Methylacidiphilales bacterium]|nr:glycosyltransferase family 4 protein [Candidatus Methylacidiphilales bacterium]